LFFLQNAINLLLFRVVREVWDTINILENNPCGPLAVDTRVITEGITVWQGRKEVIKGSVGGFP